MIRLREMVLVIAVLAAPVAWGQEGGSVAHAQKKLDAKSSETKPNKLTEVDGLTLAGRQAFPLRGLKENPSTEFFKTASVSALQELPSNSGRISALLKSNSGSSVMGTAPNAIQMKGLLDLGQSGRDTRLLDAVRNSDSRWQVLLPSDLDKK